jgi:GNAT superfamily N-acetyltransferase
MDETMRILPCSKDDGEILARLRDRAMRESLEAIGRYDSTRVRQRLLAHFKPENTKIVFDKATLIGFYVLLEKGDHLYLDHLYIDPDHQSKKYGSAILHTIIECARVQCKPLRLGALKQSKANDFYLTHGFEQTHEGEHDIYYEFKVSPHS